NQEHVERQKVQLETLLGLEADFRRELIEHRSGPDVYKDFIVYICNERRNILAARPFFRERQGTFTSEISKHLKQGMFLSLYKFNFNIQFVNFVIRRQKWTSKRLGVRLNDLADKIAKIRTEIVEMNMPLAISRARVFWSRTPKSHLTLMDLVQIAAEGLMSGIDKYVPEGDIVSRRFRSVAIGRMTGNFIEEYCVDPATKILTTDMRWVTAESLVVGDEIVGFDEEIEKSAARRKWRRSCVTKTGTRDLPKLKIKTDQATVTVSHEHMFLCVGGEGAVWGDSLRARSESPEQKGRGHRWVRADRLQPSDKILFLCRTWEEGASHVHGYLKGISDGEANISSDGVIAISQLPGGVSDDIDKGLEQLDFRYYRNGGLKKGDVFNWCVGGIADVLRFLGEVRPTRLLRKSDRAWVGKSISRGPKLQTKHRPTYATIESIESVGVGPVITLGTSTGTLVTEGLLSHNSETAIHFYPCDKRKIYRANKVMHKHTGGVDFEKLATHVNTGIEGSHRTSAAELAGLMAASSVVSADRTLSTADPDAPEPVSRFAAPESCQPDKQVENHDAQMALIAAVAKLTVFEQKLLRLKGIRF
ncbi:MAG: hypothetical protein H0U23_02620, partial [Blastocatellia bacterium]|nr:hypothetical protein [Blastocatellia bacterium]